jgi:hypothetical protein
VFRYRIFTANDLESTAIAGSSPKLWNCQSACCTTRIDRQFEVSTSHWIRKAAVLFGESADQLENLSTIAATDIECSGDDLGELHEATGEFAVVGARDTLAEQHG